MGVSNLPCIDLDMALESMKNEPDVSFFQFSDDIRRLISTHQDIKDLYGRALLLGDAEFSDTVIIKGDKYALELTYYHHNNKPYVQVGTLYIHISVYDTTRTVYISEYFQRVEILGNTRECKFTKKVSTPLEYTFDTEVIVGKNAFEGITFRKKPEVYKRLADECGDEVDFIFHALKDCVIETIYASISESYLMKLRNKGILIERLNGKYISNIQCTKDTLYEAMNSEITCINDCFFSANSVVKKLGNFYFLLKVQVQNCADLNKDTINDVINLIDEFASAHVIYIGIEFHINIDTIWYSTNKDKIKQTGGNTSYSFW